MKFISKPEAYTYAIWILDQLKTNSAVCIGKVELDSIERAIHGIKLAIENHEQKVGIVVIHLHDVGSTVKAPTSQQLTTLAENIKHHDFQQSPHERYGNPLARRLESELAITLLQQPTQAMMLAVGRVSKELLTLIADIESHDEFGLDYTIFTEKSSHPLSFGAYKKTPSAAEVKKTLQDNLPTELLKIMFIHHTLAQSVSHKNPIRHAPIRKPVGKVASIIHAISPDSPTLFFKRDIARADSTGDYFRRYLADEAFYDSPLYTTLPTRGRQGARDNIRTSSMGLMLRTQAMHAKGLPSHDSMWVADCKSQPADLDSQHVKDLIENDTVYVSGPSGMTSLLLGQMELLANFEHEHLKKNYLAAVVAYIISGGFHSLHEIIGPAEYILALVPGYCVQPPTAGVLSPPPNFHQFFAQQDQIDPEFASRRAIAWKNYLHYFETLYVPNVMADRQQDDEGLDMDEHQPLPMH